MALIVEDGTGLPNAESYISVADADTYHQKFGNVVWAGLQTADKEIALRRATAYIDEIFNGRWKGQQSWPGVQALAWPRRYVVVEGDPPEFWNIITKSSGVLVPADQVPIPLREATAIVGMTATGDSDPLLPPIEPTARLKAERIQVGPIENEVTFADTDGAIRDLTTRFPKLELKLRQYLSTGIGGGAEILSLERA